MNSKNKLPRAAWSDAQALANEIDRAQRLVKHQEVGHRGWSQLGLSLAALAVAGCSYNPFVPKAIYGGPPVPPPPRGSQTPGSSTTPKAPNPPQVPPGKDLTPVPITPRDVYGVPPRRPSGGKTTSASPNPGDKASDR